MSRYPGGKLDGILLDVLSVYANNMAPNAGGETGGLENWTGAGIYPSEKFSAYLPPAYVANGQALTFSVMSFVGAGTTGTATYGPFPYTQYRFGDTSQPQAITFTWRAITSATTTVTAQVQYLNSSKAVITTSNAVNTFIKADTYRDNFIDSGNAPAGTAFYQVVFNMTSTSGPYKWYSVAAKFSSRINNVNTEQPVIDDNQWSYLPTGPVTSYHVRRGNRANPPVDQLEVGTLTVNAKGAWDTYYHNSLGTLPLTKGMRLRLRTLSKGRYITFFVGSISDIERNLGATEDEDRVSITATDRVQTLARTQEPLVYGGTFKQRMNSALRNISIAPSVLRITDTATDTTAPLILRRDAAVLDQIMTLRNTAQGMVFVDRLDNIIAYAKSSIPAWANPVVFRDKNVQAGEKKILMSGFDTNQTMTYNANTLFLERNGIDGSSNSFNYEYGPFYDETTRPTYGYIEGKVSIAAPAGTNLSIITDYLRMYTEGINGQGQITNWGHIDTFRWDATGEWEDAVSLEIYDPIQVHFSRRPTTTLTDYRILGMEHFITPERWVTTITTKPRERYYTDARTVRGPTGQTNGSDANVLTNGVTQVPPN